MGKTQIRAGKAPSWLFGDGDPQPAPAATVAESVLIGIGFEPEAAKAALAETDATKAKEVGVAYLQRVQTATIERQMPALRSQAQRDVSVGIWKRVEENHIATMNELGAGISLDDFKDEPEKGRYEKMLAVTKEKLAAQIEAVKASGGATAAQIADLQKKLNEANEGWKADKAKASMLEKELPLAVANARAEVKNETAVFETVAKLKDRLLGENTSLHAQLVSNKIKAEGYKLEFAADGKTYVQTKEGSYIAKAGSPTENATIEDFALEVVSVNGLLRKSNADPAKPTGMPMMNEDIMKKAGEFLPPEYVKSIMVK